MSHPHWGSIDSNQDFPNGDLAGRSFAPESLSRALAADMAIDAALRSVPLPHGLLTRLDLLARTVPDERADPIDWLGC